MSEYVPPPPPDTTATSVPNYLVFAILVTIFCCLPFGIIAIVFAAQVNSKLAAGDIQGAEQSSKKAKTWCWVALFVGIAWIVIFGIFSLFMGTLPFFLDGFSTY
ncbi:MAG: CD225/dispanin family protein [Bacillota bacterium]